VIGLFAAPALPLHSAGKYVAGAYIVFVALILIYVAIMALRLGRNRRELAELAAEVRQQQRDQEESEREAEPVG
jgi:flagellar biosynthesis/type III secretory pathway M-ring protein FliF/YscJ